ncbi:molybdenum ABC transporter substrate-binding protein [Aliidongia dinghuensis]|uniref:Molybdenum ABC transporter substrate-binding protein n=1 Tax=Aliidongia dinghuensis TaxID=1867774 RepID=A0A8J3E2V6_9PROT|nr:substrate-binding domain-containing protein [Aliidongia dinghuensis]GGF01746.1 molybdenum ABC transporter substrate-binding protein [Aliidongia dinghuensis]
MRLIGVRALGLVLAGNLLAGGLLFGAAEAAEIKVMNSGGFAAPYKALVPEFEQATHNHLDVAWGPSMGTTHDAIPVRLARGEQADVLIMVAAALDDLVKQGKVVPASRVEIARSYIGMAVKAGAPKPDISTVDGLKRALLAAKSIAYSDSASGVYLSTEGFKRLGIADEIAGKSRMIPATPVGEIVARGEAELGFQQISELMPVAGIELVGPLPPEVQKVTLYAAGISVNAKEPAAAKAFIAYLTSPGVAPTVKRFGLDPITAKP